MPETKIFAVAGNPIAHSRSPEMFNAAFRSMKINAVYIRLAASSAKEVLSTADEIGISGLNITSPFKEDIASLLDEMDVDASKIGAVNRIVRENGKWVGHNTDHLGVSGALEHHIGSLKGKKAIIIGAGGAARAAAYALVLRKARVTIINRTFEKAKQLAGHMGCKAAEFGSLESELKDADILVSCIPSGERIVPQSALRKNLAVLDANYSIPTALVSDAKKKGCKLIDGREWLLFQAIPTLEYFIGRKAPLEEMRKALYAKRKEKKNVALIGFMGSGKSTVGDILAMKTGMDFEDTDELIEEKAGMPIPEIFREKGELEFRKMERSIARSTIAKASDKVFSCGGGLIIDEDNRKELMENSFVVWLWVSPEVAVRRIGEGTRPLLEGAIDKLDAAKKIIGWRLPLYAQTCDLVINTGKRKAEDIAEVIADEIDKTC